MPVVTQKMIAEATGVSTITVSRALRDSPHVSPDTKAKIREAAKRLGYVADPMLSALVNYRTNRTSEYNKIAILSAGSGDSDWTSSPWGKPVLEGMEEGCQDYGFSMELFHLHSVDGKLQRMLDILTARGIESVILLLAPEPDSKVYAGNPEYWKPFHIVRIEFSEDSPPSHCVGNDQYGSITMAWDRLWQRGYRRIGLEIHQRSLARVHGIWEAAFLWKQQQMRTEASQIPALLHEDLSKEMVQDYVDTHHLDAIIGRVRQVPGWLREGGIQIPEQFGWVGLDLRPDEEDFAGIVQQRKEMGRSAVNLIHRLKLERQFGALPYERDLMLKGIWKEGRTVRPA